MSANGRQVSLVVFECDTSLLAAGGPPFWREVLHRISRAQYPFNERLGVIVFDGDAF